MEKIKDFIQDLIKSKSGISLIKKCIELNLSKEEEKIQIYIYLCEILYIENEKKESEKEHLIKKIKEIEGKINVSVENNTSNLLNNTSSNTTQNDVSNLEKISNPVININEIKKNEIEANQIFNKNLTISNSNFDLLTYETQSRILFLVEYDIKKYLDDFNSKATVQDLKIIIKFNIKNKLYDEFDDKKNAVHYACSKGCSLNIVKFIVSKVLDYKKIDSKGLSVLHHAAGWCSVDVFNYFIDLGMDVTKKANNYWTPLQFASRYNNVEVVKKAYDVYKSVTNCDKEFLSNYLKDNDKETILHLSAENLNEEVAEFLMDKVDDAIKNNYGNTALHLACIWNHNIKVISKMVSKGANINIKNDKGQTAFERGIQESENYYVREYLKSIK